MNWTYWTKISESSLNLKLNKINNEIILNLNFRTFDFIPPTLIPEYVNHGKLFNENHRNNNITFNLDIFKFIKKTPYEWKLYNEWTGTTAENPPHPNSILTDEQKKELILGFINQDVNIEKYYFHYGWSIVNSH